jgi:hypothetical protein
LKFLWAREKVRVRMRVLVFMVSPSIATSRFEASVLRGREGGAKVGKLSNRDESLSLIFPFQGRFPFRTRAFSRARIP